MSNLKFKILNEMIQVSSSLTRCLEFVFVFRNVATLKLSRGNEIRSGPILGGVSFGFVY
jgi:hypothetical protein